MPFSLPRLTGVGFVFAAALAAPAANTQLSTTKPVINFRLPNFTPEGFRSWLVRGTEASFATANQIDVKELTLSVFSGKADGKLSTMILAPTATVFPDQWVATGKDTIRVINDEFEASGTGWRYARKENKVNIDKKVRVVFQAEFKDYLK